MSRAFNGLLTILSQCNPPERVVREIVELSPMQSFIQHLLHDVLMKRTLDKVLKLLRKLHWEDPEVSDQLEGGNGSQAELSFEGVFVHPILLHGNLGDQVRQYPLPSCVSV